MLRSSQQFFIAPLVILAICGTAHSKDGGEPLMFERDIRPIFRAHCYDCHGATKKKKGSLDLRLVRLMLKGGESGAAIVAGKPAESFLIERIRSGEMPPGDARVSAKEIAVLEKWIAQGARTARPEPKTIREGLGITPEERAWWAFQPIKRPVPPITRQTARIRSPIDAFLSARMSPKGLGFSADADRRTLVKRLYLDLIGIPPTFRQSQEFIQDERRDAYSRLVNQLLNSPHYGERWGRHWLDVAGYADSEGYTNSDAVRPHAYRYRDYVIRSFNSDKPFDQFIQEQLAGDEMIRGPLKNLTPDQISKLEATGFLRMAADGTGSGAADAPARNQVVADTIKIVSSSLLGLSVGCAQCHDHRYDPISHVDYHRLRAVFEPALDWKKWKTPSQRRVSLYTDAQRALRSKVQKEINVVASERNTKQSKYIQEALEKEYARYSEPLRTQLRAAKTAGSKRTKEQVALLAKYPNLNVSAGNLYQYNSKRADEIKAYAARIAVIQKKIPQEKFVRALTEAGGTAAKTQLFYRGDYRQPQQEVLPGSLTATAPEGKRLAIPANDSARPTTGRRLAFARWLTNGRHPLVARALVNRIWLHHFGRGIVSTPDEFGKLGSLPTHPRLLDWLAAEFMESGWSVKHLHRVIVGSTAYRQASRRNPDSDRIDGANAHYWHKSVRRLDAEIIRDRILAVSGKLDPRMFGAADAVKADDAGQILVAGSSRRSIYIQNRRTQPVAVLQTFDAPVMAVNCSRRSRSTVAQQSLLMMNSDFILRHAAAMAGRVDRESTIQTVTSPTRGALSASDPIVYAWRLAYARDPSSSEKEMSIAFLREQQQLLSKRGHKKPRMQALTNFCQVLLSSNEFLYTD